MTTLPNSINTYVLCWRLKVEHALSYSAGGRRFDDINAAEAAARDEQSRPYAARTYFAVCQLNNSNTTGIVVRPLGPHITMGETVNRVDYRKADVST